MSEAKGKSAVVIGSGFGGLAVAVRLQARGIAVTLFEKNGQVGGRASQLVRDGYTFDMGPSLVTAPDILDAVFQAGGKSMRDFVELVPLDPFYRVYFSDGTFVDYSGDAARMREELRRFDLADASAYDRFFRDIRPVYDAVITERLGTEMFDTIPSMIRFLPRAIALGSLRSVYGYASRYFSNPKSRFLFSFHPLFIGGSPFRAPSIYIMIPYLEREGGVWYARGGMYSIVRALERLFVDLGGTVRTDAEVTEIMIRGGRAFGVRVDGEGHTADIVVSNGDAPWVYRNLVAPQYRRRWTDARIDRLHIGMSVFILYLGVRKRFEQLRHHTLILSPRYRELIRDIFDRKILADDFSLYLHVPTKTDSSMAPPGCESMYILVPVPNLQGSVDWTEAALPFRDRLLAFLEGEFGLHGLRSHIDVLEQITPRYFESRLNSLHGGAFSLEPCLTQTAWFRPHNRSEDVRNLYLVGAGTHPGGGLPGVLLSAEATEKCILEDLGLSDKTHRGRRGKP
ncbi:MAG: phytoene desaturase family protein [Bacteroidota bacterium]|nr:phytoene desaturase family protein [Bacteroidota bacterium]